MFGGGLEGSQCEAAKVARCRLDLQNPIAIMLERDPHVRPQGDDGGLPSRASTALETFAVAAARDGDGVTNASELVKEPIDEETAVPDCRSSSPFVSVV